MSNLKYDKEKVIEIIVEYFINYDKETLIKISFENVYKRIVKYALKNYSDVKMPQFSQMRKFLLEYLKKYKLYNHGERLTTIVAYRITDICSYIELDNIENILYTNEYDLIINPQSPIICIIKLPPVEVLDMFAEGYSKEKNHSRIWGRINVINRLCIKIKKKNPNLILAVIPQFNRMVYLNKKGNINSEINELNTVCDTLCMFVKNSSAGRAFVEKMKKTSVCK